MRVRPCLLTSEIQRAAQAVTEPEVKAAPGAINVGMAQVLARLLHKFCSRPSILSSCPPPVFQFFRPCVSLGQEPSESSRSTPGRLGFSVAAPVERVPEPVPVVERAPVVRPGKIVSGDAEWIKAPVEVPEAPVLTSSAEHHAEAASAPTSARYLRVASISLTCCYDNQTLMMQ